MNNKSISIIQILYIICLFNVSFSSSTIDLNNENLNFNFESEKTELELINKPLRENYLKIKITGKESTIVPHIIEFCKDSKCDTRIQLSYNPTKVNYMFLTKEQIQEGNYIIITCPEKCNYELNIAKSDTSNLELDSEYTYYVSQNNNVMKFNISLEIPPSEDNFYISLWVIGVKDPKISFSSYSIILNKNEENGKYIYNIKSHESFQTTINAQLGDLISIGTRIIKNKISNSGISLNNPEIYGYLSRDHGLNQTCFKLDTSSFEFSDQDIVYISSKFYNDIGEVFYSTMEHGAIEGTESLVTTGSYNYRIAAPHVKEYLFCVRLPISDTNNYNVDKVIYGLRMSYSKNQKYSSLLYKPQRLGEFYPRIIHGGNLVSFIGMPPNDANTKTIEYNMITTLGFPDMFFDTCETYPLCFYNENTIKKAKDPHNINSMSSYLINYDKDITPISRKQNILIVNCTEGYSKSGKDKQSQSEINKNTCEFMTLIYSNLKKIKLIENQMFNQYITANEKDYYTISFKQHINLKKIYVDLMIYSGDVILKTDKDEKEAHKYQTANKIFYSINLKELKIDTIDFEVIAKKNSFYSIQYTLVRQKEKDSSLINNVPNGVNYLITIDPFADTDSLMPQKKIMNFLNMRTSDNHPFLVNFYSLNCKLAIYKEFVDKDLETKEVVLKSKDYYFSQDIIYPDDIRYEQGQYKYESKIIEMEQGTYKKKMCMLYASSIELETEGKSVERQILVSENMPQRVIFEKKYKSMKYLYVIPNTNNYLSVRFILLDHAQYNINFYIDRKIIKNFKISNSLQEIINKDEYKKNCPENQPCPLIVEIEKLDDFSKSNSYLEVTIKSIGVVEFYPTYLFKHKINNDYLGFISKNYYYTDIGQSISGQVIVNYHRGNGIIYGKIVKKNQIQPDTDAEWRGIYRFPKTITESLNYTSYLRRLYFTKEDTANCEEGCYLLLCLENKIQSGVNISSRFFSFDILITTSSKKIRSKAPIINIPLEDYIIGNVSPEDEINDSTYYIFYIPYDSDKIVFDFQSDYASFYVNLNINDDYLYPDDGYYIWKFESSSKPNIYEIKKEDILSLAHNEGLIDENINSIEGLSFTMKVSAEQTDSIFTTIYSFKVHLPIEKTLNLYEVYSDHQTLCNSTEDKSCLYVVRYDSSESIYNLLIHPTFTDQSTDYELYAKFIPSNIYDLYQVDKLKELIPTNENSEFSTVKTKEDFLFIDLHYEKNKYIYVNVKTNKKTTVKLLTTFSTYDYTSSPNPTTPQLYIIERENITFSFNPKDELMINLISLRGTADIFWGDEKNKNITHRLRGRDDRLSLTSPPVKVGKQDYNLLVIKNLNPSSHLKSQTPEGFLFYITFYLRSSLINFDELILGKSFNLNYRQTEFPLTIYTKLGNIHNDTNAFINIYILENDKGETNEEEQFNVYAWILKDTSVFEIKRNKNLTPKKENAIIGTYDAGKRVCLVSLKKEDMEKFKIEENEKPNLVIQLVSNQTRIYNRISIEGTVIQDNSLIPITEKVYQHGKLKNGTEKIRYKLRTDKTQNITYVFFSSNGDELDFKISKDEQGNDEFKIEKKSFNGRIIVHIQTEPEKYNYIYLTVYLKNKIKTFNDKLTNYAFKYINVNDSKLIYDYRVSSMDLSYSQNDLNHTIKVEGIKCKKCKVRYFVNFIDRKQLIQGEKFSSIAVIESKGIVKEFDDIKLDNEGKVTLICSGIKIDFAQIQVVAYISEGPINEYVSYNTRFFEGKSNSSSSGISKLVLVLAIVGILFFIIIITLVIVILRFNAQNKDLLAKVNATSFQEERIEGSNDAPTQNLLTN